MKDSFFCKGKVVVFFFQVCQSVAFFKLGKLVQVLPKGCWPPVIFSCSDKYISINQKQPPYVFYKKLFLKISNIHRKTPVLKFLFNKVAGLKIRTNVGVCEYCGISKNTYFEEHLRTTDSDKLE